MLITVLDRSDDPGHAARVNALHQPAIGIVTLHVPPACRLRDLVGEIMWALDRPLPEGHTARDAQVWATAWLSTAWPRCDLLVYGAWRLTGPVVAWLRALGTFPAVTVWLITHGEEPENRALCTASSAVWPWSAFSSKPWRQRRRRALRRPGLAGFRAPSDWRSDDLPPFPFSLQRLTEISTRALEGVDLLQRVYSAHRGELLNLAGGGQRNGRRTPRTIAAAVARITLLANGAHDLSVLLRLLEEDLFFDEWLLVTDPAGITRALASEPGIAVGTAGGVVPSDIDREAVPAAAARRVVELSRTPVDQIPYPSNLRPGDRIEVAADGSHFRDADGRRCAVPPVWRWPFRAAVRAAELDRVSESTARGGWFPSVHLPRDAEPVGTDLSLWGSGGGGQFDRAALRPIVDLIGPHLSVERLDEVLRPPEAKRPATAGMKCLDHDTGCALLTLFQSDSRLRAPSIRSDRDQSAVAWLVEHGLAVESPGTEPRLADWLFHVMSRDTDGRLTPVLSLPRQRSGPAARG